ncbi:HAD family hydrolase [Pseudanabaena sp. FACHB-2040]|uniref:HAD family hydrolase n=1 Tax=Pseudanabaena sp. FACHB-2040 TaxID=2692859 RepID=UPI0016853B58|nr:HAD family hydrolase [Pseudanabaena sp. FACHB-2040]MBD2257001.1 HAD family hydrolase [Pseudanabaena sp. FACHB-2040]
MTQLQALIFDVDGTLAETERDGHRLAFNQAFADFNLGWDWSVGLYGRLLSVAGGKERIRHYVEHYQSSFVPEPDMTAFCTALHQAKTEHFKAILQAGAIPLRPGVQRLIQNARKHGVRLAIATTGTLDNVLALLQATLGPEAPDWFEVIAAGDIVPEKKPAPDIYLYTLDKMALAPEHCLVIEDSHQGLIAATRAGLNTVVTVNDYTRHHDMSAARLVLNHLGDPHRPFKALSGNTRQAYYFTLELAKSLLKTP